MVTHKAMDDQMRDKWGPASGSEAKACFVCGRTTTAGTSILHEFLCTDCEYDMTVIRASDPEYDFFIRRWAEFWHTLNQQSVSSEGSVPGTVE